MTFFFIQKMLHLISVKCKRFRICIHIHNPVITKTSLKYLKYNQLDTFHTINVQTYV